MNTLPMNSNTVNVPPRRASHTPYYQAITDGDTNESDRCSSKTMEAVPVYPVLGYDKSGGEVSCRGSEETLYSSSSSASTKHSSFNYQALPPTYQHATGSSTESAPSHNMPRIVVPPAPMPTFVQPRSAPRINYQRPVIVPQGAFHSYLATQCEFVQPPQITPVDHPTPTFTCHRLFLGQIRFETSAAEVRWLIRRLTGVTAIKIEPRGCGCFLGYFRTKDEAEQVLGLHKRILFDHTGVWYARTQDQFDLMRYYVESYLAHVGRGFRLPKDTIVVEEEKSSSVPRSRYGSPASPVYSESDFFDDC